MTIIVACIVVEHPQSKLVHVIKYTTFSLHIKSETVILRLHFVRVSIFCFSNKRTLGAGWWHGADRHSQINGDCRKQKNPSPCPGWTHFFLGLKKSKCLSKRRYGHPTLEGWYFWVWTGFIIVKLKFLWIL